MIRKIFSQKGILLIPLILFCISCTTTKMMTNNKTQRINPSSRFVAALCSDHKDNTYKVGEDIYFFFAANTDCYLTLLDIGKDGKIKILLPNLHQKNNIAKAGFVYRLPSQNAKFRFKAREPVGERIIIAVATKEDISLYDPRFTSSIDILKHMKARLESIDKRTWTECQTTIKVMR